MLLSRSKIELFAEKKIKRYHPEGINVVKYKLGNKPLTYLSIASDHASTLLQKCIHFYRVKIITKIHVFHIAIIMNMFIIYECLFLLTLVLPI